MERNSKHSRLILRLFGLVECPLYLKIRRRDVEKVFTHIAWEGVKSGLLAFRRARGIGREGLCTPWQRGGPVRTTHSGVPWLLCITSILLNAGQNWNDLVDSVIMPQHEMLMCQLMYQSLTSAFKRRWEAAMFNVYRHGVAVYKPSWYQRGKHTAGTW